MASMMKQIRKAHLNHAADKAGYSMTKTGRRLYVLGKRADAIANGLRTLHGYIAVSDGTISSAVE